MIPIPVLGKRWRVSDLFKRRQGAWFEPRQGYMWQENTGVTPTTTGGQTIGKLVDLSAARVASQSTVANRPIYQLDAKSLPYLAHDSTDVLTASLPAINVRRNLLLGSEQFDNAIWVKTIGATITPNTVAAPDSSVTADTLSILPYTYIYQAVNLTSGITYTLSFYARTLSGTKQFRSMAYKAAMTIQSDAKTASTNWTRFSWTFTSTLTDSVYIYPCFVDGFVSADIAIFGAQLELGSVATDYQKITDWTSEQYSSAGSVYFATPQGMSCLHNQSIGTSYNLPAPNTDIYGVVITPARLAPPLEQRLAVYMHRLAGLADADFFWQEDYGPECVDNGTFTGIPNGTSILTLGQWSTSYGSPTIREIWEEKIKIVASGANQGARLNVTGLTFGQTYELRFNYSGDSVPQVGVYSSGSYADDTLRNAGDNTIRFQCDNATFRVLFRVNSNSAGTGYFDNVSISRVLDGQVGQLLADDNDTILLRA